MPEIRKDPVTQRWVIIAPERNRRPQQEFLVPLPNPAVACPFCAGQEDATPPEVFARRQQGTSPNRPGWTVRVVRNKFPALEVNGDCDSCAATFFDAAPGLGIHEVVIECPDHQESITMLTEPQVINILGVYRERIRALNQDERWRSILIYKNHGILAGATIPHLHSQLIALPVMPPLLSEELTGAQRYYQDHTRCVYCDMIRHENIERQRIVLAEDRFIVLCPYASRFPFETWIVPTEHQSHFEVSSDPDLAHLASVLRHSLLALKRARKDPPFNYLIHSGPSDARSQNDYHWHFEILPRLTQAAGFEWGSGSFINPVAPEEAARLLRDALR